MGSTSSFYSMNKVILGVLALLAITLGSGQGAEESQDKALASDRHYAGELANLNHHQPAIHRRAREAAKSGKNKNVKNKNGKKKNGARKAGKKGRKPKRKGGKRKGKKKAKKQSKGKKSGKRGKKGKKNKKRKNGKKGKGRKKEKKGAAKSGKKPNQERQADAATTAAASTDDCTTELFKAAKDNLKYASYSRIIARISRRSKIAKSKKEKAHTSFNKAVKAIQGATDNCTACVGNKSEKTEAIKACNTLSNCANSASYLCAQAEVTDRGLIAMIRICLPDFRSWVDQYESALRAESCSDIKNLPQKSDMNPGCFPPLTDWKELDKSFLESFNMCVKSSTAGSFGDCRKNERMAAYLSYNCVEKCPNNSNAVVSTASSGRRQKHALCSIVHSISLYRLGLEENTC